MAFQGRSSWEQWKDTCFPERWGEARGPSVGDDPPALTPCALQALQCDVSVEEDNRQEWTFTLYGFDNSGKATREVMHLCLQKMVHQAGSWQQTDARALVLVMRRLAEPSRVGGEAGPSPGVGAAVTQAAAGA